MSLKPESILDIGANVGQFHNYIKELLPNCFVYSIEANPLCAKELIKVTDYFKIALLGDETKQTEFYTTISDSITTGASIFRENTEHFTEENLLCLNLRMVRLDDLDLPDFDFIKLDTQGSELKIIKGGEKLITKSKYILCEITSKGCYNLGSPCAEELLHYLWDIGFQEIDQLDCHMHGDVVQEDILFKNIRLTL